LQYQEKLLIDRKAALDEFIYWLEVLEISRVAWRVGSGPQKKQVCVYLGDTVMDSRDNKVHNRTVAEFLRKCVNKQNLNK